MPMASQLGPVEGLLLLVTMALLALLPSISVMVVTLRAATVNLANGIAAALGIVIGDSIFLLLAIYGLSALATGLGSFFVIIKVAGGCYLIAFGLSLIHRAYKSRTSKEATDNPAIKSTIIQRCSYLTSFMAGLLITLGDLKALFFYISILPIFIDVTAVTIVDTTLLLLITLVAVGGVKTGYAVFVARSNIPASLQGRFLNNQSMQYVCGGAFIGGGCILLVRQ